MLKMNVHLKGLSQFSKISGSYFITTILNNGIPFLILPILTRYLLPEEYANIALFSFYFALSNALTGVSIPIVIAKYFYEKDKEHIAKLIGNCIAVVFVFSLSTLSLMMLLFPFLEKQLKLSFFGIAMIPLTSFSFVVFNIGLTVLRSAKNVMLFSKHQIGNSLINALLSIIFITLLAWGWQGRVLGIILSFVVSALMMLVYLRKNKYLSFDFSKKIVRKILDIVLPMIPNSFQSVMISQFGVFFIQFYFTKEILGLYSIAFQLATMVYILATTLNLSWSPFLFEQLSKLDKLNPVRITRMYYLLIGIVVTGALFISVFAGFLLKMMTSPEYYNAREFVPWFSIGFIFFAIYSFLMPILIKFEKQKFISFVSFTNMFVMIGLNFLFTDLFGYMGVVYAFCTTYFLMSIALVWKANKVFPLPWLRSLKIV